jgi:hypothetical protein
MYEEAFMLQRQINVETGRDLVIGRKDLEEAGLGGNLRIVIGNGEIRISPWEAQDGEKLLNELAGCLGEEPASEYDFGLKIGGWYEAR